MPRIRVVRFRGVTIACALIYVHKPYSSQELDTIQSRGESLCAARGIGLVIRPAGVVAAGQVLVVFMPYGVVAPSPLAKHCVVIGDRALHDLIQEIFADENTEFVWEERPEEALKMLTYITVG